MKTPTKKRAVKKVKLTKKQLKAYNTPSTYSCDDLEKELAISLSSLYELYRTKSGSWKFRKRARNGEILNHSYNSRAGVFMSLVL